ncbi:hypothetical protein [Kribbella endophytica]
MGDAKDEEAAKNDLERVKTENTVKKEQRDADLKKYRDGQGNMVAAEPTGWPVAEAKSGPVTAIAGKLGIGKAGDLALAKQLLDSERRPTGNSTTKSRADGARGRATTGPTRPAPVVER